MPEVSRLSRQTQHLPFSKLVYKVLTALSLCQVLSPSLKYDLQVDMIVFPAEL